jgi:hypothetical protein
MTGLSLQGNQQTSNDWLIVLVLSQCEHLPSTKFYEELFEFRVTHDAQLVHQGIDGIREFQLEAFDQYPGEPLSLALRRAWQV